jgi:hypothetical protein
MPLNRIPKTIGPVLLLCANLFLFCPFTIYQGNLGEFDISLSTMLFCLLVPAGLLLILLVGFGAALPDNLHRYYVSILFMLGILVWLQGNALVWKYGVLDGKSIDWSRGAWRGWVDGIVWAGLIIAAFLSPKKISRVAPVISIALLSLQCGYAVFASVRNPHIWDRVAAVDSPKKIFEFSTRQNVLHIILDTFQADVFQAIIDDDPRYYSALDGFTFFKETTGPAPKTFMSMLSLFSGQSYKNDIPLGNFVEKIYQGKTIPNVLYDQGYSIDTVGNAGGLNKGRTSNSFSIPRPYISGAKRHREQNAAFMIDLVLMRSLLHVLKKYVYHDQLWFVSRFIHGKIPDEMQSSYFSEIAFIRDLTDHVVVIRDAPAYKYFHFMATHLPYIVNSDCAYAGKSLANSRGNTTTQSRCFFKYLMGFLDKLKQSGIYDSSLIIIHGDHGTTWTPIQGRNMAARLDGDAGRDGTFPIILGNVNPLLLVKPPFHQAPMIVSQAQTELTDIPATISAALDLREIFPGQSVFAISPDEVRERKYYYFIQPARPYFDYLEEYVIRGPLLDKASWRLGTTYYSPLNPKKPGEETALSSRPMAWGTVIRFGKAGNAQPYQKMGWGAPENGFTWTYGHNASLVFPIAATKSPCIRLSATFAPFLAPGIADKQTVNVLINGQKAGGWNITTRGIREMELIIPKGLLNGVNSLAVTFNLPDAISPKNSGSGKDQRKLALAFRTMTLRECT